MSHEVIYPLGLRIAGRKVVVVGGGAVGTRRVIGLLQAKAQVTVISPEVSAELKTLADSGQVTWLARGFEPGDLAEAWLVHTATGFAEVDQQVTSEADQLRILCVNAAAADKSTAWVPAVTRKDSATVASFGGGDPRRAMALRDAIAGMLENGDLPLQRHRPMAQTLHEPQSPGTVALVGGGPAHPGLITARGLDLLNHADVVVTDRLGPTVLLDDLSPSTLVINVGKMPEHHPIPQDEINRILVEQAKLGKRVVRLKGGDPFVLGRGSEEQAYCRENGVEVEVVPGVTSAISVPAAAGIPVTHRGLATGFSVLTGHEQIEQVPGGRDHTVVLLMGVNTLAQSAAVLASTERGLDCPVAVIEDGFLPTQRVTISTLEKIGQLAQELEIKAPAVTVVGDVVLLSPFAAQSDSGKIDLEK